MQQVLDSGLNSLSALRAPDITPRPRGDDESPLLNSGGRRHSAEDSDLHGAQLTSGSAPQIKIFPQSDRLFIRIDHPVRELLVQVQKDLGEFVRSNLKPHPVMGFLQAERESIPVSELVSKLRLAREGFEALAADRSDGFSSALTIRSVAGEASIAIDHTLIDLVISSHGGSLAGNEMAPYLHALTNLKHGLGQLLQQFDGSMLQFVQQSGALDKLLGGEGGGQKAAAKSKRG